MTNTQDKPPSYFAALGSPCCSCWGKSELEWIGLAYVRALAKDGDVWKRLSREQVFGLLTPEETGSAYQLLKFDWHQRWFDEVSDTLVDAAGARKAWWTA
jgi:hypothetical protein